MKMFSEIREISELRGNRNYPFEDQSRASGPKILPKEVYRQIREGRITLAQYVEDRKRSDATRVIERAALNARPVCHQVVELAALNAKPAYGRVIEVAAMRH